MKTKNTKQKKKLSHAELMAGKCSPDETVAPEPNADPRFLSPDELLKTLSHQAPGSNGKSFPSNGHSSQANGNGKLEGMKQQHEKEILRWKMYEQQVNHWKKNVLEIVHNLQSELEKHRRDPN